jgi:hypothetical protein
VPHDELPVLNIKSPDVFELGAAFRLVGPPAGLGVAQVLAVQLVRVVLGCCVP